MRNHFWRRLRLRSQVLLLAAHKYVRAAVFRRPFTLRKLPGWISVLVGASSRFLEHEERIRRAYHAIHDLGGEPEMISQLIQSYWFSFGLIAAGVAYLVFVGEPEKGVQRQPWWPIVGWISVSICISLVVAMTCYGYFQYRIIEEAGKQTDIVRRQALGGQLFWHMTEIEKMRFGEALDQVPESERFDFKIWCSQDVNSKTYTEDLAQVLVEHKWKAAPNCLFNNLKAGIFGIWISMKAKPGTEVDLSKAPPEVKKISEIFIAAQISFVWGANEQLPDNDYYVAVGVGPAQ